MLYVSLCVYIYIYHDNCTFGLECSFIVAFFSTFQGLRFEVVPSWFKETLDKRLFKAPHEYAVETARQKALEVARRMPFVS